MPLARLFPAILLVLPVLWTQAAVAHGSVHERLEAVEQQLAARPDAPELLLLRARLHHEHGDTDLALRDLRSVGRLAPALGDRWLLAARIHLDAGKPGPALDAVERLLEQNPDSLAGLALRSRIHEGEGEVARAISDSREVLRLAPKPNLQQHLRLIILLEAHGTRKEVTVAYAAARRTVGPLPLLLQRQADWLGASGDREGASTVYSELRKEVPSLSFSLFVDEARLWVDHDRQRAREAVDKAGQAWKELSPVVRDRAAIRTKHEELRALRARVFP